VLLVLATQINSILAEWAVSRCLRTLAQVIVKSLSGRAVYRAPIAPVMRLAARIIAIFPISSALPASRVSVGKCNHSSAIVTARKSPTRRYEPIHLQVDDPQEIVEMPIGSDTGRVKLDSIIERKPDPRSAKSIRNAFRHEYSRPKSKLELWREAGAGSLFHPVKPNVPLKRSISLEIGD
jgi:hypothetical protein